MPPALGQDAEPRDAMGPASPQSSDTHNVCVLRLSHKVLPLGIW